MEGELQILRLLSDFMAGMRRLRQYVSERPWQVDGQESETKSGASEETCTQLSQLMCRVQGDAGQRILFERQGKQILASM